MNLNKLYLDVSWRYILDDELEIPKPIWQPLAFTYQSVHKVDAWNDKKQDVI